MRYYARPQHMPVLMATDLVAEMEARWPVDFQRTRRHQLRLGDELELNFLYHHYLRVEQFAVIAMGSAQVHFAYAQRCAKPEGTIKCSRHLASKAVNFVTFNDDATDRQELQAGLANLHRLLRVKFGTFQH